MHQLDLYFIRIYVNVHEFPCLQNCTLAVGKLKHITDLKFMNILVCVSSQVLCDEESCCGESIEIDSQEGKIFGCGCCAIFKDVCCFEG